MFCFEDSYCQVSQLHLTQFLLLHQLNQKRHVQFFEQPLWKLVLGSQGSLMLNTSIPFCLSIASCLFINFFCKSIISSPLAFNFIPICTLSFSAFFKLSLCS